MRLIRQLGKSTSTEENLPEKPPKQDGAENQDRPVDQVSVQVHDPEVAQAEEQPEAQPDPALPEDHRVSADQNGNVDRAIPTQSRREPRNLLGFQSPSARFRPFDH